jgi:drug/metabolite transporter (DMT)-like permease
MKPANKSVVEIHLAVLLFGLAGLFAKWVLLPPLLIVLGRVLFAALSLILFLSLFKYKITLKEKKDYLFLFSLGVLLAVHWWTFFQAIRVSTVAVGLLTFSTFPIFVTFLEPWFFKERIRTTDILLTLVTFLGVILVIPRLDMKHQVAQGALWGIASGFSFAILSLLNRKLVKKYSSLVIALYQDSAAAVVLTPLVFFTEFRLHGKDILLLAILGLFFTALAHSLFIQGLTGVKARTASIITCLEPVYGIIAAIFLLGEIPAVRTVLGGILILGTGIYATLQSRSV